MNQSSEKYARFNQHLEDLKVQGDCYVLPTMIRTVRINNVGPIEHLKMVFSPRGPNVILGPNGSGKTALIKSIAYAFGLSKSDNPYYTVRKGKSDAEIEVEPCGRIEIRYEHQGDSVAVWRSSSAVLLDEPLATANSATDKYEFLKWVDGKFVQTIVASSDESLAEIPNSRILKLTEIARANSKQKLG